MFQGTIQIQKRQLLVEKTHEDELNDMKDNLIQCQQGQEIRTDCKVRVFITLHRKDLCSAHVVSKCSVPLSFAVQCWGLWGKALPLAP